MLLTRTKGGFVPGRIRRRGDIGLGSALGGENCGQRREPQGGEDWRKVFHSQLCCGDIGGVRGFI